MPMHSLDFNAYFLFLFVEKSSGLLQVKQVIFSPGIFC